MFKNKKDETKEEKKMENSSDNISGDESKKEVNQDKELNSSESEKVDKSGVCFENDFQEKFLRVNADFQNFKRRVEKEKAEWIKIAQIRILESVIPFLDDLNNAIKSSEKYELTPDMKSWVEGFKIIQKNFNKTLTDLGVTQIDCSGQFDPNFHEALVQVESKDHKSGDIVEVFVLGYLFNGEVVRAAKVSVAK